MALFDVWHKGNKIHIEKVKTKKQSYIDGFNYLTTINNSTKASALKQIKTQISSGMLKLKNPNDKSIVLYDKKTEEKALPVEGEAPIKKAIYCDFNGVLDDHEKEKDVDFREAVLFRLPKISCPHKVFRLIKLALDTDSSIIMTSLWRLHGGDYYSIIRYSLLNSGIEEYSSFYTENRRKIRSLARECPTEDMGERTDEIRYHIQENKYTHFVVFEDDHFIEPDLNPIMVNTHKGLQDEHIDRAYEILK